MRKHNSVCNNPDCNNTMYRRPVELEKFKEVFCSRRCYADAQKKRFAKNCKTCGAEFFPNRKEQKYCGKSCATKASRGVWGTNKKRVAKNSTILRREMLEKEYGVCSCMVEGCSYSRTLDVHRYTPGKAGGEYVVGTCFYCVQTTTQR